MRPMQSKFRTRRHNVPSLNMASMPDLIFTVLFFFMIVTHMRSDEVKVRYEVPQGKEMKKLANKSSVVNIYIGRQETGDRRQETGDRRQETGVACPVKWRFGDSRRDSRPYRTVACHDVSGKCGTPDSKSASRPSYADGHHQRREAGVAEGLCPPHQLQCYGFKTR